MLPLNLSITNTLISTVVFTFFFPISYLSLNLTFIPSFCLTSLRPFPKLLSPQFNLFFHGFLHECLAFCLHLPSFQAFLSPFFSPLSSLSLNLTLITSFSHSSFTFVLSFSLTNTLILTVLSLFFIQISYLSFSFTFLSSFSLPNT